MWRSPTTALFFSIALLGCGARTDLGSSSSAPMDAGIGDVKTDVLDAAVEAPSLCPAMVESTMTMKPGAPQMLALGSAHSCLLSNGAAWCWGTSLQHEIGPPAISRARPVIVKSEN